MPNWVFNTLTIQGPKKQIDYIKYRLNEPFTKMHDSWNMETQELESVEYTYDNPVFSFWNIIRPTDLETYALQKDPNADPNKWFSGDNWYDWNVRNWGTKWDVAVSNDEEYPDTELLEHVSHDHDDDHWLIYKFNTAWSPAKPAMLALSKLVPNCVITLEYEEETGWGGESEFVNGKQTQDNFYDWKCRECDNVEEETPYCENCEHDMCPACGYGEPDYDLQFECPTHGVELKEHLAQIGKAE